MTVFDPGVAEHVCDYCGTEWRSPTSAAMCCDAISNDTTDNDVR